MLISILLMALGIFLLIKGSDIFVDAGTTIGKIFKMSEVMIGLTIVCIGTSLPELILSVNASLANNSELIIANILGTNILNMCIILGLICLMNPLKLLRTTVRKDMYMSLLCGIILIVVLADTFGTNLTSNVISVTDGIILLLFFAVFMYYTLYEFGEYLRQRREQKYQQKKIEEDGKNKEHLKHTIIKGPEKISFTIKDVKKIAINFVIAIVGAVMVHIGSGLIVNNIVLIAEEFNVSQTFITIIIVATGTSLPELSTSFVALKKNRVNIAIGNLIGSNMFNTLFVLGTASIVNPIKLSSDLLFVDAGVFVLVCLIMILFTKKKQEISRTEGLTLISIYIMYIAYVIYRR